MFRCKHDLDFVFPGGSGRKIMPYDLFQGSPLNKVLQRGGFRVGMNVTYFPFGCSDKQGHPVGFDVDPANWIAKALGVKLEIREGDRASAAVMEKLAGEESAPFEQRRSGGTGHLVFDVDVV